MNSRSKKKVPRFPRNRRPRISVLVAEVKKENVQWLWVWRIPRGKLALLDGDPGVGKSVLSQDLAARVSAGQPMPLQDQPAQPGHVVIVTAEDSTADTIRPRLETAGANLQRVSVMSTIKDKHGERGFRVPDDLPLLEKEIRRLGAVLVILDPLMAFLPANVNSWRDQDVRRALAPLAKMAERTGAAVLVIRHLNKKPGITAIYRGGGSIGIAGAARSALLIAPDPHDPSVRVLTSVKSNLARTPHPLAFRIVKADNGSAKVVWVGKTHYTADELLNPDTSPHGEAVAFLRKTLERGPMLADLPPFSVPIIMRVPG